MAAGSDRAPGTDAVIVVVPAHDEGARVGAVVEAAGRHLPVIVVDDGSSDSTAARAGAAGARVVGLSPNQGKGAALRAGFGAALDAGAAAVITLDGDGQHDPDEIPRFLDARLARDGAADAAGSPVPAELVIGRRDFGQMPPVRRLANALGTLVLSAALGRWIPDNQSGYRLVGRRLMAATMASREPGFAFEVEMIAICLREGWPIAWLPIRTIYAGGPSHIRPGRHLREFLAVASRARRIARGPRAEGVGGRDRLSG